MQLAAPLLALCITIGLILWFGTGRFGRAQTQVWIDRVRTIPWLHAFLDRHHGKFRAAMHYLEFGGLFLVQYWIYDAGWDKGRWVFNPKAAAWIALVSAIAAFVDELHQLQSGTRQFRRVDFLHSCCGIALAAAAVQYQDVIRNW